MRYRFSPCGARFQIFRIRVRTAADERTRGMERKCKLREFRLLLCKSTFRPHPPKITRPSDYEIMARTDRIYRKPAEFLSFLELLSPARLSSLVALSGLPWFILTEGQE